VTLKIVIADDEPLARLRLRSLIQGLAELDARVVGEAGDADEALALLRAQPADVVLLDIRMPGAGPDAGLLLAEGLKRLPQPPAVIFVTAYAEHALRAFELEAVDYLTKPVRSERLHAALQRVRQRLNAVARPEPAADGPALVVSDRGRVLRLPLAEVLVLKAEQKYVTLRTAAHQHLLDETLAELEQRLAQLGGDFVRIHRNALVARRAMRALELRGGDEGDGEGWAVRVAPLDEWLAVSRRQLPAVKAALADEGRPAP
jgi:two-component system, LytTR family, response regulator AlgR